MRKSLLVFEIITAFTICSMAASREFDLLSLEKQFRELPLEARRLTGPLFWLHGDESREKLEFYLQKVIEGGNGTFTAESRPHNDWLGEGWYRDLKICLEFAKKNNLTMWIFDERWWPSQMVAGRVPPEYGSKMIEATSYDINGPVTFRQSNIDGSHLVAVIAGKETQGGIDGDNLVDLTSRVEGDELVWEAPEGKWKVMIFTWRFTGQKGVQQQWISVDGASRDCVAWFLDTVYQPHYEHFKSDFGKTIKGFFYDEPETQGDWGTEVRSVLDERKVDWKKALAAYKFKLKGEDDIAASYQYLDAFAEAWGRTMYGGMSRWCREHGVISMGHFMEHGTDLFSRQLCAGNMFQLQKYSDMGGIDLVCRQFYPGQRIAGLWQMAKLGSSVAHVYNKADDIAMCEIFGDYKQDITYPQMKWLTDQMQVRGINFMIPHSFNPRSPYDMDCPPYFYNGGFEPRWPLYRIYADYTSRLSLLLSGGRHICPIAFLYIGQSYHTGKTIRPDEFTDCIQDALFDCDWMPYEVFENDAHLKGKEIELYDEAYRILIVPPAEVIPYGTMLKAKEFFDEGGVIIGYGFLPSKSATVGFGSDEISKLCNSIWGSDAKASLELCKKNSAGGRSYFLPEKPTSEELKQVLTEDAGVQPVLEVVEGQTDNWLHVLHRVKSGCDIYFICNQDYTGDAKKFRFKVAAEGEPECWDPMRNEINILKYEREGRYVEFYLTLEPSESTLVVFNPKKRSLPARLEAGTRSTVKNIMIKRDQPPETPEPVLEIESKIEDLLGDCSWVWYPEGDPAVSAPPSVRYFRKNIIIGAGRLIKKAVFFGSADNDFTIFINGRKAGKGDGGFLGWQNPVEVDVKSFLKTGGNQLAISAMNATDEPSPAGLIGKLIIEFEQGGQMSIRIDKMWKTSNEEQDGWNEAFFDDSIWPFAVEVAEFGKGPWGILGQRQLTLSPVKAEPFYGHFEIPVDLNINQFRVYLEMNELSPEAAASITINDQFAGGFIGKPFRLEVAKYLKAGRNNIRIEPFAPEILQLVFYSR